MIDILLSSFSKEQKSVFKLLEFWEVFISLLSIFAFFILYIGFQHISWFILGITSIIIFFIIIYKNDKTQCDNVETTFQNYNAKLNKLKETLESYKYGEYNWYSKEKIIYLIECLENSLEKDFQPNIFISMARSISVPIISFIAGIIAEKWEMDQAISIALCILILGISIIGMIAFGNFICDIAMKSQSKDQKRLLLSLLKDLLHRDF